MAEIIFAVIVFSLGIIFGMTINHNLSKKKYKNEEIDQEKDELEDYVLTEEDKNKVISYALKQLKYNQNELQISTYDPFSKNEATTESNWRYYAFLEDIRIIISINGVIRWKSDSETSLLRDCADEFISGNNPFEKIQIELRYGGNDIVSIEDWNIIEKFIDILYDNYFKINFHSFVSAHKKELKKMNEFCRNRKKEIYNKIGIGK